MLIQIAVGSLYMFSVPRGFTDGFVMWIKQVIATCLTAFLQSTMLVCGLILFKDHWLMGLGIMLAAGMSFVTTDSKGDLYRNTATISERYYGYKVSVIDLRNPTRSSGYNMLYLVNKYMDMYKFEGKLEYKTKSEKFAKITAKTIISAGGDVSNMGQNVYHI